MRTKTVLGRTEPDTLMALVGLDTGYRRFYSEFDVDGLARDSGDELRILAVVSNRPGKGRFSRFIRAAQKQYQRIYIWEVWSPLLAAILTKWGWHKITTHEDGEPLDGFIWQAPNCRGGVR